MEHHHIASAASRGPRQGVTSQYIGLFGAERKNIIIGTVESLPPPSNLITRKGLLLLVVRDAVAAGGDGVGVERGGVWSGPAAYVRHIKYVFLRSSREKKKGSAIVPYDT